MSGVSPSIQATGVTMYSFSEWASHYGYQDDEHAWADYQRYRDALAMFQGESMRVTVANMAGGTMRTFHSLHRLAEFAAMRRAPLGGWRVVPAYCNATVAEMEQAEYLLGASRDAMREWRFSGRAVPRTADQWRAFASYALAGDAHV